MHLLRIVATIWLLGGPPIYRSAAATVYWTNSSSGQYSSALDWSPNGMPSSADIVAFTNAGAYTFNIDVDVTNSSAFFYQGSVTQAIPATAWFVTNEWGVGESAGSTSRVTAVGGLLIVTNESRSGLVSVGRVGTGELAIRGGSVVADMLMATNGSRSILTFGYGELTTLGGLTVSNGGKLFLGAAGNGQFVWNASGGINQIITGQSLDGGLTLGTNVGGGRARVNLTGSNTVLTVPRLDTYGRNALYIGGGARFQTWRVQLGLQSGGISNVVIITDPGSAWINGDAMGFGVHSGSQTLIVTNGGYFQTGNPSFGGAPFKAFANTGTNRIIVTGSNSLFRNDGLMTLGEIFGTPRNLNNLILVTNGGHFSARRLVFGSPGSLSGTLFHVADGTLYIGELAFSVGTLFVETGSAIIDYLNVVGGTNAILQTRGSLYVGHQGNLGPGELRVGAAIASIPSLSGELQLGGWQLGASAGSVGTVTITGGRAFVTNVSQTGTLVIGGEGSGLLHVNSGTVLADRVDLSSSPNGSGFLALDGASSVLSTLDLVVGPGGTVMVTNNATLQLEKCFAPPSSVLAHQGIVEFVTGTPELSANAIVTTNAVVSFRNVEAAEIDPTDAVYLGRLQRDGQTRLQLIHSTNSYLPSLTFRSDDPAGWSGFVLNGGTTAVRVGSMTIEANSSLAATNSIATIDGVVTNRGLLLLNNSTLRFLDSVVVTETSGFHGQLGVLLFDGGLHLPATDVIVPPGVSIRASSITSGGGKLIINGGGVIANEDGTVPGEMIVFQNGWVTYLDATAAPVAPPAGLPAGLGLELIRSTNALVTSPVFATGNGGYERLRLGKGSVWQSDQIVVGQGGAMFMADPSATVALSSRKLVVEHGGWFRDLTDTSHIGFIPAISDASATVSGIGSVWETAGTLWVGSGGSRNKLLVESGGELRASFANIGINVGVSNVLALSGPGTTGVVTNRLTIAGNGAQFLVRSGAGFTCSQVLANGAQVLVSLTGTGTVVNCSDSFSLAGLPWARLDMADGAALSASNLLLNAVSGSGQLAEAAGTGTVLRVTNQLTIAGAGVPFQTNRLVVSDKAVVVASSAELGSQLFSGAALLIRSGQFYVTNVFGSGNLTVYGRLDLDGGLFRADRLTAGLFLSSPTVVNLRAGRAEWSSCLWGLSLPLRIGDGTNLASLNLLGGTNSSPSGLEVRRYSKLMGRGVIVGSVTNHGWLWPSNLTVRGDLLLDSTSDLTLGIAGGPGSPLNSSLVVTGAVSIAGKLGISITSGTLPSPAQSFVLLQASSIASGFANVTFGQRLLTTDRLASCRIDKTGTSIIATDFQSEDLDGDGIQDAWAMQHFGISPLPPGSGANALNGDSDGDGISNHAEFVLGTNPNDSSSGFFLQMELTGQAAISLHFPYFPGRSYLMRTSADLISWNETLIEEFSFDENGLAVWSDGSAREAGRRFYRLLVQ